MSGMNTVEMVRRLAEENEDRKILAMLKECQTIEEAIKKVEALLLK